MPVQEEETTYTNKACKHVDVVVPLPRFYLPVSMQHDVSIFKSFVVRAGNLLNLHNFQTFEGRRALKTELNLGCPLRGRN
jgi:hypothetical protein